jgi:cobalt-zinc-cadmium efflux system outer membrane protein
LDLQYAAAKPDLTVNGGLRFIHDGSDAALVAAVSWPLPVRHQNQGNVKAAREELAAAEQSVTGISLALRHEFDSAWQDLTTAHATADLLRTEALPALEALVMLTRQAHELGQVPLVQVVLAARDRVELEHQILAAEAAYIRALVQLDALTDPTLPLTHALLTSP